MDVGVVGLGLMGMAMARNIAQAGHSVRGWNRSAVTAPFDRLRLASSPAEAFDAEVVFTMLSDDAAIRSVILDGGVLDSARKGAVHVVTSTISIECVEELMQIHARAGIDYVSAPVFGRPDVAAAGQLNIMVAGPPAAVAKVQPLFDVIGRKTWPMGEVPKQANAAKIAGNMMIAMAIEAMSEAVAITSGHGVTPAVFFELITQTLFSGRAYENYSQKIVSRDFEPGFKMKLGLKDLTLALAAAERSGKKLPQLDAVHAQMTAAVVAGMGERDWSAVAAFANER